MVDRAAIIEGLRTARGDQRNDLAMREGLFLFLEDKNPAAAAELFNQVVADGSPGISDQARLLLAHCYRAQGKRRTAVFTYGRLARREPADDCTVLALIALVDIGDETTARVSQERLDAICAQSDRPAAADLLVGGDGRAAVEAFFAPE
jgi:hypothetical protein